MRTPLNPFTSISIPRNCYAIGHCYCKHTFKLNMKTA